MRISTPVTSRARNDKVMSQCVTRTTAECRETALAAGATEPAAGAQAVSAISESVPIGATPCTQAAASGERRELPRSLGQLNLAKDDKYLELVVWDAVSRRLGTLQIPLEVPKLSKRQEAAAKN